MPCYDSGHDQAYENRELKDKCNKLTRLLCEVMTENKIISASMELQEWWWQHQEIDRQRAASDKKNADLAEAAEELRQLRQEVIKGLTPRQRELLNL